MTTTNKKTPICLNVSHPPPALAKVCFGLITDLFPNILTVLGLPSLQIRESVGTRMFYSHSLLQSFRCYCNVRNKSDLLGSKIVSQEKKKTNQKHLARLKKKVENTKSNCPTTTSKLARSPDRFPPFLIPKFYSQSPLFSLFKNSTL